MTTAPTFSYDAYWADFEVDDEDLEFIYNLLLEREAPLTTDEMVVPLVEQKLKRLEKQRQEAAAAEVKIYRPAERYQVGEKVAFPLLEGRVGTVVAVRPGDNPEIGPFEVIEVAFEENGGRKEFAASLENHKLNQVPTQPPEALSTVEGVLERYGKTLKARLEERLNRQEDIVRIAGRWFPRALLIEFHEGHLNIAEAVLDVAGGGPLPTSALLEHLELPPNVDPLLAEFSLDYALQEDERFDEVGPAGQVLWYLRRLEPPEVLFTPPRLEYEPVPYDRDLLTPELLDLERRLEDELSPQEPPEEPVDEVTLPVLFPHWRVGTLPLSARLSTLFPTAYEAPRVRFILVDGHTGEKFPGWVVRAERYVFGLDEWYRRHEVPAGGLVKVRRGEAPGEVVVEAVDRRRRNDWIRTAVVSDTGRIGFTMLKQPVGTAYDELMVVGVMDREALDEAWLKGPQRNLPLDRLVAEVFRELAKLNPQAAVHAQALYSGVNVLRRLPPGPIFAELVQRPYYEHVGDLYWRLVEPEIG